MASENNDLADNNDGNEYKKFFTGKIIIEEKIKQEKVIPFLRDVLGFKLMDFEVPVKFGRMANYADIVVFSVEDSRKVPFLVIEIKAQLKEDDWLQAESYAQRLYAPYFVVTDGSEKGWLWYKTANRQGNSAQINLDGVPYLKVQKEGQTLIKFDDLNTLSRVIQQCHDIIRNEEGKDPAESFDEMSKLLFAKTKDEQDIRRKTKRQFEFRITFEEGHMDSACSVADRVRRLFEEAKKDYPKIYSGIESKTAQKLLTINLRDTTIYQIVGLIEPYTLIETGLDKHGVDIKGAMFEVFLKGTFRGPLGQFFTPREVIDFMVGVVNPEQNETLLDPACGSGGFLIGALKKVWNDLQEKFIQGKIDKNLQEQKICYAQNKLFGMDINERLAWVAKMNMVFHGDGHGGITHTNALTQNMQNKEIISRKYDVILTNPPFGSKINDPNILSDSRFKELSRSRLTEVLFLSLCVDLLKPRGRLGIVLPDGILTNSSLSFVRDYIKENTIIKAVVSLPPETFMPYGSGVKASSLFLEKRDTSNSLYDQGPTFMAIAENIGYDATGKSTGLSDFQEILEQYHKFEETNYKKR